MVGNVRLLGLVHTKSPDACGNIVRFIHGKNKRYGRLASLFLHDAGGDVVCNGVDFSCIAIGVSAQQAAKAETLLHCQIFNRCF